MNNHGQVDGSCDDGRINHGFIWSFATGFETIDYPGAFETFLAGISDDGTVVGGYALSPVDNLHGLTGTESVATPQPRSVASVAVGFLFAITIWYKKRPRANPSFYSFTNR
jgi:hypothetical protein